MCCHVHLCHCHLPLQAAILQVAGKQQVNSCTPSAGVSFKGPLCMAVVSSSRAAASRADQLLPTATAAGSTVPRLRARSCARWPSWPTQAALELQAQSCSLVQGATMDERARLQRHLHDLRAGLLQLQDLGNQHLVPLQLWGLCLRAVDGSGLDEGASEGYLEHLWDLLLLQV